ncbi:uncharacterized protein LAESUDRAFT_336807 [Laetiporus sulphureus 93-53]|uniref:Uncharacterized protein n=1 Tax=Laetiporus sulphureus 93-53 TaxID=1314785 RepID=A0A165CW18_9APHY|nr:uncharacterized protein LAESUDRAFT_336807 [Laetiporus sulphureus 93-53]KZT03548.1 hypothetical protein LAESUDRAFT_336807 [Laetiporus sulphureus 93-53]
MNDMKPSSCRKRWYSGVTIVRVTVVILGLLALFVSPKMPVICFVIHCAYFVDIRRMFTREVTYLGSSIQRVKD